MQVPNDVTSVQIESMITSMRFIYKRLCVGDAVSGEISSKFTCQKGRTYGDNNGTQTLNFTDALW